MVVMMIALVQSSADEMAEERTLFNPFCKYSLPISIKLFNKSKQPIDCLTMFLLFLLEMQRRARAPAARAAAAPTAPATCCTRLAATGDPS